MAITLRAFWGPTSLMFLDRHDVFKVCGLNNRSVIEMMNEGRCHYYVFRSLLQNCHGLEGIYYIESFLGTYIC